MEKIQIHTERLYVRNLDIKDLKDFHDYRSNPEVTKYQGFDVFSIDEAQLFIDSQKDKLFGKLGDWVQYGIEDKISGKLIGDCAIKLDRNDERIAEVGLTISHKFQQKGFAKEVFLGIIDYLFSTRNIHRIVEIVDAENVASIKLMESIGFKKEGHFVENIFFKGKWGSEIQFAMLKKEWFSR